MLNQIVALDVTRLYRHWVHSDVVVGACRILVHDEIALRKNSWQLVQANCGATKQKFNFAFASPTRQTLERIPKRGVFETTLVHRKITFEHASLSTEKVDALVDVGTNCNRDLLRIGRRWARGEIEAEQWHTEPPDFDGDIGMSCEACHLLAPRLEHR